MYPQFGHGVCVKDLLSRKTLQGEEETDESERRRRGYMLTINTNPDVTLQILYLFFKI